MTLDALEFLRRFLQHVLPSGFQKVRYYGFLSANACHSAEKLRWLEEAQCLLEHLRRGPGPKRDPRRSA